MYGLETNELMVFKENNKAFVLDRYRIIILGYLPI